MNSKQKDFCRGIPIFSCVSVRGEEWYAKLIRFFEKGFSNHTAGYYGGGKNLIFEATPQKAVNFAYLTKYLNENYEVKIYANLRLMNFQIEKLKNRLFEMMAETKQYNFLGLLRFVPIIRELVYNRVADEKFCSQAWCRLWYEALGLRLYPAECSIDEVSPADIDRWMESQEAKDLGWKLIKYWKKGEFIDYEHWKYES